MSLKKMDGPWERPIYRDTDTNHVISTENAFPYESSEVLCTPRHSVEIKQGDRIINGWRFTCARFPTAEDVAQPVRLLDYRDYIYAEAPLLSLLFVRDHEMTIEQHRLGTMFEFLIKADEQWYVRLDQPVSLAFGLRLHLRGLYRPPRLS